MIPALKLLPAPWTRHAACLDRPVEWFYPVLIEGQVTPGARKGLALCMRCPVRMECLIAGLESNEEGTWGGTLEDWRKDLPKASYEAYIAFSEAKCREMGVI